MLLVLLRVTFCACSVTAAHHSATHLLHSAIMQVSCLTATRKCPQHRVEESSRTRVLTNARAHTHARTHARTHTLTI